MARTQFKCGCGWVFFVSEIGPAGVKCPNCQTELARGSGAKRPAAAVAADKQAQSKIMMMLVCGGIGAVLLGGLIFGFVMGGGGGGRAANKNAKIKILEEVATAKPGSVREEDPDRPPPEPTKPVSAGDQRDWARLIDHAVWKANVAGLVAEFLRLRKENDKAKELEDRMSDYEREIEACLDRLRERNETRAVPEHMLPGDRMLFFRGVDFWSSSNADKDKVITNALRSLRVGEMWDYTVKRGSESVGFVTYFKERPKELLAIIEQYANIIGGGPPPDGDKPVAGSPTNPGGGPAWQPPKPTALPADVLAAVKEKFFKLPPYYQKALAADEKAKLDQLLKDGQGFPEDVDFLKSRILGDIVSEAADDMAFIKAQIIDLQGRAAAAKGGTDVIIKNDGSRIDGRILEEKDDVVKVEFIRGTVKGAITVPRADIKEIRKGAGAATEFAPKLEAAKGKAQPLVDLAGWCKERGLNVQRELALYMVLDLDPGHELARKELGKAGDATAKMEAKRTGNQIEYAGKSYSLDEFRAMLKGRGYIEISGLWYTKKSWSTKIANLYTYDGKIRIDYENAFNGERIKTEKDKVYDIGTKSYKDTIRRTTLGKMIAPEGKAASTSHGSEVIYSSRNGSATVTVEAPSEFVECRIRASGEVTMVGGMIRVTVSNDAGQSLELYTLSSVGRNDRSYDVTSIAKGHRRLMVRAEMSSPFVSGDSGTVMFLPSSRNDSGVFDVVAKVVDPLNAVNNVLAAGQPNPQPGPGPGPGPQPKPVDPKTVITDKDTVIKTVNASADAVAATSESLDSIVGRMQEATKNLRLTEAPAYEPAYDPVLKYITDPTVFDVKKCTQSALMEIGNWWAKMNQNDRKKFAAYFGLMVAHARAKK